jgi:hypothetical protein
MTSWRRRRWLVTVVAGGALVVGFAVAQGTGLRWLGAVVLLVAGAWCASAMWPFVGAARTLALAVVYVTSFIVSHPLGNIVGTWVAVIGVALVTSIAAYALMGPAGSRVSTTSPPDSSTR